MSATSRAGRAIAGLRRRRLLGVSPGTLAARHAQAIERALDLGDQPGRNAGVAGRRLQLLVSEQRLNHANVRAALKQMGREAVAKRMQRERFTQPRCFGCLLEQPSELACRQRPTVTATGKQPTLFRREAGVICGRPRLPPLPQQVEDLCRQHHVPVLETLRLHDADDHLLTVDVARPQPHHLARRQQRAYEPRPIEGDECDRALSHGGARRICRALRERDVRPYGDRVQLLPQPALPEVPGAASRRWLADRQAELLPVPYFHVVYTLPSELRDIAYQNKRVVYDLLMKAAAETTLAIAADPKRLGARIGV